jgi:hypothetical protein
MKLATVDQYSIIRNASLYMQHLCRSFGTLPRSSISLCFNGLDLVFDEAIWREVWITLAIEVVKHQQRICKSWLVISSSHGR